MPEIVDRNGNSYHLSDDAVALPKEMEFKSVGKIYVVEVWTSPPIDKEAQFVGVETFDEYPSDDQIFWCFCKHRQGRVVRVKEEYNLIEG